MASMIITPYRECAACYPRLDCQPQSVAVVIHRALQSVAFSILPIRRQFRADSYRFGALPLLHDQIEVVADHDDGVPL
jgi:hypothetical protein